MKLDKEIRKAVHKLCEEQLKKAERSLLETIGHVNFIPGDGAECKLTLTVNVAKD